MSVVDSEATLPILIQKVQSLAGSGDSHELEGQEEEEEEEEVEVNNNDEDEMEIVDEGLRVVVTNDNEESLYDASSSNLEFEEVETMESASGESVSSRRDPPPPPPPPPSVNRLVPSTSTTPSVSTTATAAEAASPFKTPPHKHRCPIPGCNYSSYSDKIVRQHWESAHSPSNPFTCTACVCRFKTKNELTRHLKSTHGQYDTTSSGGPGARASSSTSSSSSSSKSQKQVPEIVSRIVDGKHMLVCKSCGYQNKSRNPMMNHVHSAHNPNGQFKCDFCSCQYVLKNQLTQHLQVTHYGSRGSSNRGKGGRPHPTPPPPHPHPPIQERVQTMRFTTSNGSSFRCDKIISASGPPYYKCKICPFKTADTDAIADHVKTAHKSGLNSCSCHLCSCQFENMALLMGHLKKEHGGAQPLVLRRSSSTSPVGVRTPGAAAAAGRSSSSFTEPVPLGSYKMVIIDKKINFKCEICGYLNPGLANTQRHIAHSHGPDVKYPCHCCDSRFPRHRDLTLHMARNHVEKLKVSTQYKSPLIQLLTFEGEKVYKCKFCAYVALDDKNIINDHAKKAHIPDGQFSCSFCICRFETPGMLNNHKRLFHPQEESSGLPSQSSRERKLFTVSKEGEETVYRCLSCDFSHNTDIVMSRHISAAHSGSGGGFRSPPSATSFSSSVPSTSKNSHSALSSFTCEFCQTEFPSQRSLSTHIGIKHKAASSIPSPTAVDEGMPKLSPHKAPPSSTSSSAPTFRCREKDCDYRTTREDEMKEHKIAHLTNGFKCLYCTAAYHQQSELDKHSNTCSQRPSSTPKPSKGRKEIGKGKEKDVVEGEKVGSPRGGDRRGRSANSVSSTPKEKENDLLPKPVLKCRISGCMFETSPEYEGVLQDHMKLAHSPKSKFKCEQCPCRYRTESELSTHLTDIHPQTVEPGEEDEGSEEEEKDEDNGGNVEGGKYKCSRCDFFASNNKDAYAAHLTAAHAKRNSFKCNACPCRYATLGGLNHHDWKDHNSKSQKKPQATKPSSVPSTTASSSTSKDPQAHGSKTKHSCLICKLSFDTKSKLAWHTERAHAPGNSAKHKCDICGYGYPDKKGLICHKQRQHKTPIRSKSLKSSGKTPVPPSQDTDEESVRKSLAKAARKYAGIEGPADLPSDDDDEEVDKEREEASLSRVSTPAPVPILTAAAKEKCTQCSYVSEKHHLKDHVKRAHVKDGHPCPYCSCSFGTEPAMKSHVTRTHKNKDAQQPKAIPPPPPQEPEHEEEEEDVDDDEEEEDEDTLENEDEVEIPPPKLEKMVKGPSTSSSSPVSQSKVPKITLRKCSLCSFTFKTVGSFNAHKVKSHVPGGAPCKYCECTFGSEFGAISHTVQRHPAEWKAENSNNTANASRRHRHEKDDDEEEEIDVGVHDSNDRPRRHEEDPQTPGLKQFSSSLALSCMHCGEGFNSERTLKSHLKRIHFKAQDESGAADTGARNRDSTTEKESNDVFACSKCNYTTRLRINLRKHEKKHKKVGRNEGETEEEEEDVLPLTERESRSRKRKSMAEERQNEDDEEESVPRQRAGPASKKLRTSSAPTIGGTPRTTDDDNERPTPIPPRKAAEKARKLIDSVMHPPASPPAEEVTVEDDNGRKEDAMRNIETASCSSDTASVVCVARPLKPSSSQPTAAGEADAAAASSSISSLYGGVKTVAFKEFLRYTCSRCAIHFSTSMRLIGHFQLCEGNVKDFLCNLCDENFENLAKLKEHLWRGHMTIPDKRRCVSTAGAVGSNPKPWVCELCKVGLKDRKDYMMHLSVPHLFRCKKCKYICNTKSGVTAHKLEKHPKKIPPVPPPESNGCPAPVDEELQVLFVSTPRHPPRHVVPNGNGGPGPSGTSPARTKAKSQPNPGTTEQEGGVVDTPNNEEETMDTDDDETRMFKTPFTPEDETENMNMESLMCEQCGYFSETIEEAKEHYRIVANVSSLICSICGDVSATACDAAMHEKKHEEEEQEEREVEGDNNEKSDLVNESEEIMDEEADAAAVSGEMIYLPEVGLNIEINSELSPTDPVSAVGGDNERRVEGVEVPLVDDIDDNPHTDGNQVVFLTLGSSQSTTTISVAAEAEEVQQQHQEQQKSYFHRL